MDPDRILIERARRGDLRAFEALVERHSDVVFRVAARIVGPGEADDVSQDAFLRAFHRLASFRGDAPFRAWLLQITQNAALNALSRRRPDSEDSAAPGRRAQVDAGPERQPAARLEERERRDRLQVKLEAMRPAYRALVVCCATSKGSATARSPRSWRCRWAASRAACIARAPSSSSSCALTNMTGSCPMAEPSPEDGGMTATERGLAEHLALLRAAPPRPGGGLAVRIVRRALAARATQSPAYGGHAGRRPGRRRAPAHRGADATVVMAATTILGRAGETLGVFLPRLAGALALLVIGVLVALVVGGVVTRALRGLGVDDLAERGGVHDVLARAGLGRSLAAVLGWRYVSP